MAKEKKNFSQWVREQLISESETKEDVALYELQIEMWKESSENNARKYWALKKEMEE